MEKLIKNHWRRSAGESFERARILDRAVHPEGLDVERVRFVDPGRLAPDARGHLLSVIRGRARLLAQEPLSLEPGVHVYLPADHQAVLEAEAGAELVLVAGESRGSTLLLRDERFVRACAEGEQSLRWILTPQYLSRRIFLHHDRTLVSRSGQPVSWFHTTMFDVLGLPPNEEGRPVFKMSYNSRTEFNVCYDVRGDSRVRMALHPYHARAQAWGPWQVLDGDSTYHLNEAAGGAEEEWVDGRPQRNKHEVSARDGYVSLYCLFDPAPAGMERHRPGEYSDYEPLQTVLGTPEYAAHQHALARYDLMVDQLSLARARGRLGEQAGSAAWALYQEGARAQRSIEAALLQRLAGESPGRERVVAAWTGTMD